MDYKLIGVYFLLFLLVPKAYSSDKNRERSLLSQKNKKQLEEYFESKNLASLWSSEQEAYSLSQVIEESLVPLDKSIIPENSIVLAFSPTKYHAYLLVKDFEYHGKFYPGKSFYRKIVDNSFRAGLFFVIKNINKQQIAKTIRYIKFMKGHKTDSCIRGALEVLFRGSGLSAPDDGYLPTSLVSAINKQGFMDQKGKIYQVDTFITHRKSLTQIQYELRGREFRYLPFGPFLILSAGVGRTLKNSSQSFLRHHYNYAGLFPVRNPKSREH